MYPFVDVSDDDVDVIVISLVAIMNALLSALSAAAVLEEADNEDEEMEMAPFGEFTFIVPLLRILVDPLDFNDTLFSEYILVLGDAVTELLLHDITMISLTEFINTFADDNDTFPLRDVTLTPFIPLM